MGLDKNPEHVLLPRRDESTISFLLVSKQKKRKAILVELEGFADGWDISFFEWEPGKHVERLVCYPGIDEALRELEGEVILINDATTAKKYLNALREQKERFMQDST